MHGAYRSSVDESVYALTSAVAPVCMADRVCDVGCADAAVAVLA